MKQIPWRAGALLLVILALIALTALHAPIPQPPAYHDFADHRTIGGIPNAWNVLSNLPFAVVGVWGLSLLMRRQNPLRMGSAWERWPVGVFLLGIFLTTFGSSYYHWAPDNAHLVWDRLPMTIAFMALLTATVAERVSLPWARRLFLPLLLLGMASVIYWYQGELAGQGDLRPYLILVQGGSLILILLMVWLYPSPAGGDAWLYGALLLYALAKVFEEADRAAILLHMGIGGHCIKHVLAAAAVGMLVRRLQVRSTYFLLAPGNPT